MKVQLHNGFFLTQDNVLNPESEKTWANWSLVLGSNCNNCSVSSVLLLLSYKTIQIDAQLGSRNIPRDPHSGTK